jgi:hypothetical protein
MFRLCVCVILTVIVYFHPERNVICKLFSVLLPACHLLSAACCLPFVVCCLLPAVCYLLPVLTHFHLLCTRTFSLAAACIHACISRSLLNIIKCWPFPFFTSRSGQKWVRKVQCVRRYVPPAYLPPPLLHPCLAHLSLRPHMLTTNTHTFAAIQFVLSDKYSNLRQDERQSLLHEGVGTVCAWLYGCVGMCTCDVHKSLLNEGVGTCFTLFLDFAMQQWQPNRD